jgi:hypothetical protein
MIHSIHTPVVTLRQQQRQQNPTRSTSASSSNIMLRFCCSNMRMLMLLFATTMFIPIMLVDADNVMNNMLMRPGERVSALNRTDAVCTAGMMNDLTLPTERTVINFYYAIESTTFINTTAMSGRRIISLFEEKLFRTIHDAVLWCYYDETDLSSDDPIIVSRSNGGGQRRESSSDSHHHSSSSSSSNNNNNHGQRNPDRQRRQLSLSDARRLSILSYSTSPADEERFDSKSRQTMSW